MAAGFRPTRVYLEVGTKRVFACSVDWPGWCRPGRDEYVALAALATYAPRYALVAAAAGVPFDWSAGDEFDVVEKVSGDITTNFGAPSQVPLLDAEPLTAEEARRQAALVAGAWSVLDTVAFAAPERLRKGPRGGGRDRDPMLDHVLGAEAAYARKIGVRHSQPAIDDIAAIKAMRGDIVDVLQTALAGTPLVPNGWPPRYAARRIAWHVLDHAWEIEDKSEREDDADGSASTGRPAGRAGRPGRHRATGDGLLRRAP